MSNQCYDRIVDLEIEAASVRFNLENARDPHAHWTQGARYKLAAIEAQLAAAYGALEKLQAHHTTTPPVVA